MMRGESAPLILPMQMLNPIPNDLYTVLYDSVTKGVNARKIILAKKLKKDSARTRNLSSKYQITIRQMPDIHKPIITIFILPHRG
jgi:hypothetical protein